MRKKFVLFFLLLLHFSAPAQSLQYFLPDSVNYNPSIPKPGDIIHHEVGEYHVTHDRLVNYMRALAQAAPDRIKLETMGYTYEKRPQVLLIITSPSNHQRLEEIRQQHVALTDPRQSAQLPVHNMPIVVYIGHSIHGNEASGSNASLVSAYYLAAAQGKSIDELLQNTVILFDPSFNPDGLQRFSTWVNQHKSKNLVTDPSSREYNEVWPGGRYNHYWFDLNRDWLPAVHPESKNRLEWFHKWKPNILNDHHEQGSNATFFFQPGVPSRVNPLTPARNQELTAKLGEYHAKYLERIGSLYFTKENYDDFYYGKGSTYPDVNGAIGILFEQASSRGHLQETNNGLLSFPFTIRNQFVTTLSTLEGAVALRKDFLEWQRNFYQQAIKESAGAGAYVFGDVHDGARTQLFIEMLLRHQIEVYSLKNNLTAEGQNFPAGSSFAVPLNQPQYRLIRGIFDKTLQYKDSLFYDITSWTMPLAYDLPFALHKTAALGERITKAQFKSGDVVGGKSQYSYLFTWDEFFAPKLLYALQQKGIMTRVATNKFDIKIDGATHSFGYGTIQVPVKLQSVSSDDLYTIVKDLAAKNHIDVYSVSSGSVLSGSDLGSSRFAPVQKPSIAMITGAGVTALDAGEVWHLLDQRMDIPMSHLEPEMFNRISLNRYNTIVMASGNYNGLNKEKLKAWVQAGGTLVLLEGAIEWAAQAGIASVSFKKKQSAPESLGSVRYIDRPEIAGAQIMRGAIFEANVDTTHPLAYGYRRPTTSMFKANSMFLELGKNPFAVPFYFGSKPLQSGWLSKENAEAIAQSAAVVVNTLGAGRVINIAENTVLRGYWLGGTRLLMNALFFGKNIDAASGRAED